MLAPVEVGVRRHIQRQLVYLQMRFDGSKLMATRNLFSGVEMHFDEPVADVGLMRSEDPMMTVMYVFFRIMIYLGWFVINS